MEQHGIIQGIEQALDKFFYHPHKGLLARYRREQFLAYDIPINDMGNSVKTDANGNAEFVVYENSTGRDIAVSRLQLWADGFDPGNKYTAGGTTWCGIFSALGGNPTTLKDFFPKTSATQLFPTLQSYGEHAAPRFKRGENVVFRIFNGPASTNITVKIDGWLKPAGANEDTYG